MSEKNEETKIPESKVEIKEVDIKDDLPPKLTDKFVLVVIKLQKLSKLAKAYIELDNQGYDFLNQINCLSRDVHLMFKRRKKK